MLNTFAIDRLQDGQCIAAYSLWQSITNADLRYADVFVDEMIHQHPYRLDSHSEEYISYTIILWGLFSAMTQEELDELVVEWSEQS